MRVSIYIIVHNLNVVGCEEKRDAVTVMVTAKSCVSRLFIRNINIYLHRQPPAITLYSGCEVILIS
jgi:hypothetical protein